MKQTFLLIMLAFSLGLAAASPAQGGESPSETRLKAAYLYNFAKFIHWPEESFANTESPLIIGVLGATPLAKELAPLATRKVRNRAIEIRQFDRVEDSTRCHILYISPSFSKGLRPALEQLSTKPIVTVGDQGHFTALGGVIQFVTRRDRLRFIIHLAVARENRIKIDAQLLSLAVEVVGRER